MSSSASPERSPEPQERQKPSKIFVTNLDVETQISKLQSQLWQKFSKYGKLESVVVKRSYNNQYSFAFIEFKEGQDALSAVTQLSNTTLFGKKMKVELQDNARRRKGGSQTCFICGKPGHYARNCRQNKQKEDYDRSDSESSSEKKKKKHKKHKKHRRRSSSSESREQKKKHKKKHSKKIKKQKKKKERKSYDSESSA